MSATSDSMTGAFAGHLLGVEEAEVAPPLAQATPALRLVDPFAPSESRPQKPALRLSVVIPATDSPKTLERCFAAVKAAHDPPAEIVIVGHPHRTRPATARNLGARMTTGDVLVFVDADVEVHSDVFVRIREMLAEETGVTALFGSYDDHPEGPGAVSQFRNLLHHHVHQGSPGTVGTFWAGLGAIRRDAFDEAGGFIDHPIEDIELGMRLTEGGKSIVLDPRVQGKHLKIWTVGNMVKTDLLVRGAPWIGLALRHHSSPAVLNLGWRHRISAMASVSALAAMLLRRPRPAVASLGIFLWLNRSFYRLLIRRAGLGAATVGIGLHLLHHLTGVAAVPTGVVLYVLKRPSEDQCDSDSSA